jgi:hypothetical protein
MKIWKVIPFTIASKRIKYLGVTLRNVMKVLCTKNYKILMKSINQVLGRQRSGPSQIEANPDKELMRPYLN